MSSWITPAEVSIRDEGAKATDAVLNEDGSVIVPALPARQPWPAGVAVICKSIELSGDTRDIRRHTNRSTDGTTEYLWFQAGIATLAAVVLRVEGDVFRDTDGQLLDFSGSFEQRMAAAEKLPQFVQDYVYGEILRRRTDDPFGLALQPTRKGGKSTSR